MLDYAPKAVVTSAVLQTQPILGKMRATAKAWSPALRALIASSTRTSW
jgi:hypothetical protein